MSQHGHPPSGGAAYPQGQAPYPQGQAPYSQQGGAASYPGQAQQYPGAPPYAHGQGTAPYPGQGHTPYPVQGQGHAPASPAKQGQGHGSAPYPGQGPVPYPSQAGGPYPGQAQGHGSAPYPGQGQGQSPYPAQGQGHAPYSGQGQGHSPYPTQSQGHAPYPAQGNAPYPGQNQGSTPPAGPGNAQAPYAAQGHGQVNAPYPGQGQNPYPGQSQSLYPGQGQSPYPGQGQSPYPGQSHAPYPAPGQGQAPPHPGPPPPRPSTGPIKGAAPYPQGQGYPGAGPAQSYGGPPTGTVGADGRVTQAGTDQFKSRVEIRVECKSLLNKDILSKSDPCACLYMMRAGRWEEVGRTENVINCLDPRFSRCFVVNYFFEEVQKMRIAVYDIDNNTPQLDDDDFLGQIETTLGHVVSNSPVTAPLLLKNGHKAGQGTITIRTEEIKEGTESVCMTFRAMKLDNKDFFGKSDPYLEIMRATKDGSWQVVHKTEVIKNNLNPSWRPFELSLQTLCGGNRQQSIKIDCYDWDSDGTHDYIGGFTTTFDEMAQATKQEMSWPCVNPSKKAKKKNYSSSGTVILSSIRVFKEHTFLDYISGGMQINFTVGVDFTASNGNPSQSSSLHYINPYQPNEYMSAIRAVGDVCQDYDTDKLFPALGFGAKIPPRFEVSHEFAINFNPHNPYCQGIEGVLQAYYNCIQQVQLYGPTNAAPIIQHVARFALEAQREEQAKGAHSYFILLMLTDGVLSDMSNTRSAIVAASKLPMSLIIVGVGQADFDDMEILDGDNGVLRAPGGEMAHRDIVQFVPYRDFKHASTVELARHVLAEVPKQVTGYFKMRGMQPNKKPGV